MSRDLWRSAPATTCRMARGQCWRSAAAASLRWLRRRSTDCRRDRSSPTRAQHVRVSSARRLELARSTSVEAARRLPAGVRVLGAPRDRDRRSGRAHRPRRCGPCRWPTSRSLGALWWLRRLGRPDGDPTKPFVDGVPRRSCSRTSRRRGRARADGAVLAVARRPRDPARPTHGRRVPRLRRGRTCARRSSTSASAPSSLSTETRVHVADPPARRKFRRYWFVIRPFSGLIRILLLRAARRRAEAPRMKLVTFGDDERVGFLDGDEIAVLDAPTMREYFERGGADETGERIAARRGSAPRADRPEEVLPHGGQLPRARGGVEAGRLVARDRALDRLLPERRRDRRARRARRLPRAPDRGARLRARARGRAHEGGEVVLARRSEPTTSAAT